MHSGQRVMVQRNGPQHLGTGTRTGFEMFDRHIPHFVPPVFGFLPHLLLACVLVPSLFFKDFWAKSHIADWNYVVVRHEIDDLEG